MSQPVYNTIEASIISDIKASGSSYNPSTENYKSGGTTYDLERVALAGDLQAKRVLAGTGNAKIRLTQDAFDKIKTGTLVTPPPIPTGSHPVFVIGTDRFKIIEDGKAGNWQTLCGLAAFSIDPVIKTDIQTGGAVYDAASQGYKIGGTVYTIKRAPTNPNYQMKRQTGTGNTNRIYLTAEMFDVIKVGIESVPPLPCNHPVFSYQNVVIALGYFSAGAAPFQGVAVRHNGP